MSTINITIIKKLIYQIIIQNSFQTFLNIYRSFLVAKNLKDELEEEGTEVTVFNKCDFLEEILEEILLSEVEAILWQNSLKLIV